MIPGPIFERSMSDGLGEPPGMSPTFQQNVSEYLILVREDKYTSGAPCISERGGSHGQLPFIEVNTKSEEGSDRS